jgi:hypothetical protein
MLAIATDHALHSIPPALLGLLVLTLGAALLVWVLQRLHVQWKIKSCRLKSK